MASGRPEHPERDAAVGSTVAAYHAQAVFPHTVHPSVTPNRSAPSATEVAGAGQRCGGARLVAIRLAPGGGNRADFIVDPSMIVEVLLAALAAGFFLVVPVAGVLAVGRSPIGEGTPGRLAIVVCAGIAVCSVPLMASLIFRVYSPPLSAPSAGSSALAWVGLTRPRLPARSADRREGRVPAGLVVVAPLYLAAPRDPIAGGRDMAVYATTPSTCRITAALTSRTRTESTPAPAARGGSAIRASIDRADDDGPIRPRLPGVARKGVAAFGYEGALRFNAVLSSLRSGLSFALARRFMPEGIAALAVLFLAFDAGQVWVVRNTLSEPMTQLFV